VRILHVTDHYTPVLGGIETHVHALAHRQAERGDDVTVLTSTRVDADGRHADDTGPVQVRRERSISRAVRWAGRDYDVVHAHISVVAPFTSPVAGHLSRRGLPTVVTVHSMWSSLRPVPAWHADATGLRRARVTWTAVSSVVADQVTRQLPRGTRVGVLPNAVEADPRPRTPAPAPGRTVQLVSTMRIARRKRPLQMLQILADLAGSTTVPLHLTVIGDGPLRPAFEASARELGVADLVTVTGRVEPEEVLRRLGAADVYVAPSVLESFGLAALEARCVGLPVVGRASGMVDFVRDGAEGWLCHSDAEIVERLRWVVEDDDLRWLVSEHNRTTPSPLTWASALERHDEVYDLAGSRPRTRWPALLVRGGA
jgi:glycosyltransferase involved in cell wall biosynthesis